MFAGDLVDLFSKKPHLQDPFLLSTCILVVWSMTVDPCGLIAPALGIPLDCLGCC